VVLDCGSPLPLFYRSTGAPKRQRAAAVQDAGARFDSRSRFGGYEIFENALNIQRLIAKQRDRFLTASERAAFMTGFLMAQGLCSEQMQTKNPHGTIAVWILNLRRFPLSSLTKIETGERPYF
jgi:hypothetical protein